MNRLAVNFSYLSPTDRVSGYFFTNFQMFSFLRSNKVSKSDQSSSDNDTTSQISSWRESLSLTRSKLGKRISQVFGTSTSFDDDMFEELETILLTSDVGISATTVLLENTKRAVKKNKLSTVDEVKAILKSEMLSMVQPMSDELSEREGNPYVILVAGVNGAGKTTTIGKLTKQFAEANKRVLLAAGDTFRAAAEEQLRIWGERNQVTVVSQDRGDSAAVIFDAIQSAKAKHVDIVIADTAGRLPTQQNLMEELRKVKRVMGKALESAPNEIILVVDSNTGQNAAEQVKSFDAALGVDSIVLTKLDGSAKGGCIFGIAQYKPIPIRYVGVGEGINDLAQFSAQEFIDAIFD